MNGLVERAAQLLRKLAGAPDLGAGEARGAANGLVAEVDQALADLHRVRRELVSATRRFDDASARRIDERLGRR